VWGPKFINANAKGSSNKESVFSAIDLVPSLLDFTDTKTSEGFFTDGENIIKTLLGKEVRSRRKPLYYSRPPDVKNYYTMKNLPDLAVREGDWKLLCDYNGDRPELYNLKDDIGELKNIAENHPVKVNEMTKKVIAWYNSMP
jgi:uncharacterized sulfatase